MSAQHRLPGSAAGIRQSRLCGLKQHGRALGVADAVAVGGGDVSVAVQAQQADGQPAQRGHHAGRVSRPDQGFVLLVGDAADPVELVLDLPVPADPDGLESRQLAVDPLVGVASEKLASGLTGPVSVADLLSRGRLIQFAAGSGIRKHVDAAVRRAGLEVSSPFELNQVSDMLVFAALGLGVTIVPRTLTQTSPAQLAGAGRRYVVLGLTDPLAVHPVTVVFAPSRLSVSAQEFVDLLTAASDNKKKRS